MVALALVLVSAALVGCAATPAGPPPTLPHASSAPVVVPAAAEPARPGTAGKSRATQKPGATSDAEWRTAFCKTQDLVFELQFATRYAAGIARSMDIEAFRRTLRIVRTRAEQARRALVRVPARYARPLVAVELAFLRSMDAVVGGGLTVLRTRSASDMPPVVAAAKRADRQWASMVRLNHRLQEGEHRLICR